LQLDPSVASRAAALKAWPVGADVVVSVSDGHP